MQERDEDQSRSFDSCIIPQHRATSSATARPRPSQSRPQPDAMFIKPQLYWRKLELSTPCEVTALDGEMHEGVVTHSEDR